MGLRTCAMKLWPAVYGLLIHLQVWAAVQEPLLPLDLLNAPWKNMLAAVATSMIGGCWAFLRRVANDDLPKSRVRWIASLLADLLASVIVGLGIVFVAEMQGWGYGTTMLSLLGGGIGASLIVEKWRQKGAGLGGGSSNL